jgi:Putative Actinobacterial Holin-X, holin superfamily III
VTETSDTVDAPPEDEAVEPGETDSVTELVVQLGREVSVLVFCEAQLAASRNMPEARRAVRDIAAALVAAVAFLTAFVFANVAAMLGLTSVLSSWLAAVVLTAAWIALGTALAVAVLVRAGRVTGWRWWRVFSSGADESLKDLERARAEAEKAVRETLERLAPAITVEIAAAAVPMATDAVSGVVDVGGDVIEASDDMVEALADDLPGGGVVNQMWDVVLMPGRFGVKVATTVLKRGEPEG